jgi:hypothetical protein
VAGEGGGARQVPPSTEERRAFLEWAKSLKAVRPFRATLYEETFNPKPFLAMKFTTQHDLDK